MSEISILTVDGVSFNLSDDKVRGSLSEVEMTPRASKTYAVGDYLIYQGRLYKVVQVIDQDSLFEIGTNIIPVTVGEELELKASLESPTFSGSPKVPTADVGTRTTQIASTAYVQSELDSVKERIQSVQNGLDGIDANIGDRVTAVAASTTTAWMNAHITNTNTVLLDTSLTVEGAAADAKAVGDAIDELPKIVNTDEVGADFDLADSDGNVLVRFEDGHIKVKNFDSSTLSDSFDEKIDIQQDVSDVGKALVVGDDGKVSPADISIDVDTTLSIEGAVADAKAVGDALDALSDEIVDSIDELDSSVDNRITSLNEDLTNSENKIAGIKNDLYKEYEVAFEASENFEVGQALNKIFIDVDIPQGAIMSFRLSSESALFSACALYAYYSESNSDAMGYNYALNTDYTYTALHHYTGIKIYVSNKMQASGTLIMNVSYNKQNADSFEEQIETITDDIGDINEVLDDLYVTVVVQEGEDLISGFESGDIDSNGAETTSGSYYRTGYIDVDATKEYILGSITTDSEGTKKITLWKNTSYGIIHCYDASSYLGSVTVGTGTNEGIVDLISGTTRIRISHVLVALTNLALYPYNLPRNILQLSGHTDVTTETFDTNQISLIKIEEDQIGFRENVGTLVVDKSMGNPWHLYVNNYISSAIIPITPGSYYSIVNCTGGFNGYYISLLDNSKTYLDQISVGSYNNQYVAIKIPDNVAYIVLSVAKNSIKLSDIQSFSIYKKTASAFGYTNTQNVIKASVLPQLPPMALTGQAGGGIMSLGHGGVSSIYAEDSIESFYALARQGYAGTEIDIQFTKDHIPVCWHNSTLSVLDGGTSSDHIYDYTLEELNTNFDFRTWWDKRSCFRSTVATFEEFCVLARAYGWTIIPDKLTSAEGSEETDNAALITLIRKYKLEDKMIINKNFTYLVAAFQNCSLNLSSQETTQDDEWMNAVLRTVESHCHEDADHNLVVDDDYTVYTSFNWKTIKDNGGTTDCVATNELCAKHNVKIIWYTVETPEDIYQLVSLCPDTAIVLTGLYTIPDGMNEYLGLKWGNNRYDLSPTVHL